MAETLSETILVATFYVGEMLCGMDTARVQEVVRLGRVTPVHDSDEWIVGIINLRGRIVTILDLRHLLGLGCLEISDSSRVFIVESEKEYVGLLADRVGDVVAVDPGSLAAPPASVDDRRRRAFQGIFHDGKRVITVLNIDSVIGD